MAIDAADSDDGTLQDQCPEPVFEQRMLPGRRDRLLAFAALLLACSVLLGHASLIFGGRWDGDEFNIFAYYRDAGLQFLFFSMLHWETRPLSEIVLYLYAALANWAHAPLITPFLATVWALLAGSAVAVFWRRDSPTFLYRLSFGFCLATMFLLGHPIDDMFFWLMGGSPYVVALAALVVATFQILDGASRRGTGRWIASLSLSIAVLSVEGGMFVALGFTVVLGILQLAGISSVGWPRVARAGWYLIPLALSLGVLGCAAYFRLGESTQGVGPTDYYFHHLWRSMAATLETLPGELLWNGPSFLVSLPLKVLLLIGFVCFWRCLPGPAPCRSHIVALAAGLMIGIVLAVLASYYQYGTWGFGRHRTFIQCLLVLLLVAIARVLAGTSLIPVRIAGTLGPSCLIAAMALGLVTRLPGLINDHALLHDVRAARFQTWASGHGPGPTMRFVLPPHGEVLEGMVFQTGHFTAAGDGVPWYVPGVLRYFHKSNVDIVQYGDNR